MTPKLASASIGIALLFVQPGCVQHGERRPAQTVSETSEQNVIQLSAGAELDNPPRRIYVRAFKHEKELEIWGADKDGEEMKLVVTYPIARMSGRLGPKREEGDGQVPEGLYVIERFNPQSQFHLSLGLNYPNASDRVRSDPDRPGTDIFIHGDKVSIGCLAMTDPVIEEIWLFATTARDAGQRRIPVHVFPARLTEAKMAELRRTGAHENARQLWEELKPFYDAFEARRLPPSFSVRSDGAYVLD